MVAPDRIPDVAAQLGATDTMPQVGAHALVGEGVFYRIVLTGPLDLTAADFILWRS